MIDRIALYHLETLFWITRLGTFRAAAERLNTTQPAVSARMRELEAQLGLTIFRREGRVMALTVGGRQLVRDCEPLWAKLRAHLLEANDYRGATGIVRIGSGEIAAATCLPQLVAKARALGQGINVEVEIDLSATLLQQLLAARIDIALLVGPIAAPAILAAPIGSVDLLWLASPDVADRLRTSDDPPDDIAIWSLSSHSPLHQVMMDTIAATAIPHRSINLCNNVRAMEDIVRTGRNIGIFPESMVRDRIADGSLIAILPHIQLPSVVFQAIMRRDETDPIVLRIFEQARQLRVGSHPDAGK